MATVADHDAECRSGALTCDWQSLVLFPSTSPAPYDHPRRVETRADRRSSAEMDGSRGRWAPASLAERRGPLAGDDSLAVWTECVSASNEGIGEGRTKASRAPSFRL